MSDKKRYPKNPLRNPTQKVLRAAFGDLEIVDAVGELKAFPTKADFDAAKRMCPGECGFKQCLARSVGATAAVIFASTSFIDHVCKDGIRRINRYRNSAAVKAVIRKFDRGEKFDLSKPFVFLPPSLSLTLRDQRAKGKRLRASPRGKVLIDAWMTTRRLKVAEGDLEKQKARLGTLEERYTPQAPSVVETKKEVQRLRASVRDLREEHTVKQTAADKVRTKPFKKKWTNGHLHNLDVRNGTGRFTGLRAGSSVHA